MLQDYGWLGRPRMSLPELNCHRTVIFYLNAATNITPMPGSGHVLSCLTALHHRHWDRK